MGATDYLQSLSIYSKWSNCRQQTWMLRSPLTPAQDSQSIDHCGVGVCSHQAVRVEETIMAKHHSGQVFQIDLVNDPWTGRNDSHVPEGFGTPLSRTENTWKNMGVSRKCSHSVCSNLLPLRTEISLCCAQTPTPGFSEGCQIWREKSKNVWNC